MSPGLATEYILAFDLSLDRLDVALATPEGEWLLPHRAYTNNWPGYLALKQEVLTQLEAHGAPGLAVAGESTGWLWWHIFYQLATDPDFAPYDPQLALLNPLHVKHFRRAQPEDEKCDPKDARLIGKYYRTLGVKHPHEFDERYLPLRTLTRAYCRLTHTLAAEKAYAFTLLYLFASEYTRLKPFSDRFGVTSSAILSDYPDIAALADLPLDTLADTLDALGQGHFPAPQENAAVLHQVAQDSYPCPDCLRPTVHTVLTMTLEHIRFLEAQRDDYQRLIRAELADLPEARLALDYHGLGPLIVGGCLAEIQDTRRFVTGRKFDQRRRRWRERTYGDGQASVAKLAGLWWPRRSSGRFEGEDRPLARERNPYLRYWLVQAAHSLKGKQDEYARYYQRKFAEVKKHQHKRALILTARKAVRLLFALLHKGQLARLKEDAAPSDSTLSGSTGG